MNTQSHSAAGAVNESTDKDHRDGLIAPLETAIADIAQEAAQAEASATGVALVGLGLLIAIKIVEGIVANSALETRFSQWLSDRTTSAGLSTARTSVAAGFVVVIFAVSTIHFAFPGALQWLSTFPTDP